MGAPCFCGHGFEVKGVRMRASNFVAGEIDEHVVVFEGALADGLAPGLDDELRALVAEGRPMLLELSARVHGGPRVDGLKERTQEWLDRAQPARKTVERAVREQGYVGHGWDSTSEQVYTGERLRGVVVRVRDTGTTVNTSLRVELTVRVERHGEPVELTRKVLVPRTAIPRVDDRVEVAFDPDEPDAFAFRLVAGDDPADDRIDRLERLGRLRDQGVLSEAEFEAEKRRLLDAE